MQVAQPKWQWLRLALLALLFTAVLVALAPLSSVYADEPDDQSILISNDGKEIVMQSFQTNMSPSFRGTGFIREKATTAVPLDGRPIRQETESIIGPDGRTQVTNTTTYPNRAIASLVMTFSSGTFICTGWFIGPDVLATAGHCVYDPFVGEFASSIMVYPGRNGAALPNGKAKAIRLFTNKCWKKTASPECDYGAIKINKQLGNQVGWFGFGWYQDGSALLDKKVNVRGYPGDKPSGTMWTMKGPIQQVTSTRVGYSIDTFGGQSGSPVYGTFNFANIGTCKPCGVAIHAYGVGATPFDTRNSGVRISQKVYNALCNWRGGC